MCKYFIKRVLLDMDGVLCDFDRMADEHKMRKPNGKCDWQKIKKEMGSQFWSEMEWMPDGEELYEAVKKFCQEKGLKLGILSAIFLPCGVNGKEEWISYHCPDVKAEDILITDKGINKWKEMEDGDVLIDDKVENLINIRPSCLGLHYKGSVQEIINLLSLASALVRENPHK